MSAPPATGTTRTAEEHRVGRHGAAFGMWLFLVTELLFFGGLFLLYSVFRAKYPQEFHAAARAENTVLGSVNTVILITSSLSIALALSALKEGRKRLSACLQGVTLLFGSAFLVNKYFEWGEKIAHGMYPDSPVLLQKGKGETLFYSLYYVMTGLHGLHVLIGICVIAAMLWLTVRERITARDFVKLENTGLYWHFVDIVWIYLFPLFYLVT
ncbi:MAG: cytochrome c oxidase subunit 3 family protein [Thermodesulfovibrionales bacterium]